MWWTGPEFFTKMVFSNDKVTALEKCEEFSKELKEVSSKKVSENLYSFNINVISFVHELINLSNNYLTVLCIVNIFFRFINNLKFPTRKVAGSLKTDEVKRVEIFLLKEVQRESFYVELPFLL